jgi:hypothetical protein
MVRAGSLLVQAPSSKPTATKKVLRFMPIARFAVTGSEGKVGRALVKHPMRQPPQRIFSLRRPLR